MLQAYLAGVGDLRLRHIDPIEPGPGEITVEIRASLSCGTDLKTLQRGHALLPVPSPFGHEAAGVVLAVGSGVEQFKPGQPVMWVPTAPCGRCQACSVGLDNHCQDLFSQIALGAHAEVIRLPERIVRRHVFIKPDHLSYEVAALLEPLACVIRGQQRLGKVDKLLIIGVGAIGLLHVAVARRTGYPEIWVLGGRPSGLRLAERLGASRIIAGHIEEREQVVRREAGPLGFDAVIECTGNPRVWERAPHLVRPGGKVLFFGGLAGGARITFDAKRLHYHEVDLMGSFHYTSRDVQAAYNLLSSSDTEWLTALGALITHQRDLTSIVETYQSMQESRFDGVKAAFYPNGH